MKIIRDAYESCTRRYELTVDKDYIEDLNKTLAAHCDPKPAPVKITLPMVIAVAKGDYEDEEYPELEVVIKEAWYGKWTVGDFIADCLHDDIWEAEDEIIDCNTEDYEDEIILDPDEREDYHDYQMTIFDLDPTLAGTIEMTDTSDFHAVTDATEN